MAELKARDVGAFVRNPDLNKRVFLIYGPDRGLVSETCDRIAEASGVPLDDPFSAVRLYADSASQDSTLVNEVYTTAMFAGKRVIRVTGSSNDRNLVSQIETILGDPPTDAWIVLEAGELKKGAALRTLVEKSDTGITIPSYSDGPQAVHALIDEAFPPAEGKLDRDVRHYLASSLSGDRALIRRELEKMALLAADGQAVGLNDAVALVGDVSETDANSIIDAVISGRLDVFETLFLKVQSAGLNVNTLLFSALRQFQQLDVLRGRMDQEGKPAGAVVAAARPPVFFGRRQLIEKALQIWTAPAIRQAMKRLQDTVLQTRQSRDLGYEVTHICLLGLTIAARRRSGGR